MNEYYCHDYGICAFDMVGDMCKSVTGALHIHPI